MASSTFHHLSHVFFSFMIISFFFVFFFTAISSFATAATSSRPRALLLPVSKDPPTLQYLTHISQGTPLVPLKLTLDLAGRFLWADCEHGFASSSYRASMCDSALCKLVINGGCDQCPKLQKGRCTVNGCVLLLDNTVTSTAYGGDLSQDVISIQSTDGPNPGMFVSVPHFPFTCAPTSLLKGLANGVAGMAGLGWTNISLPPQLSAAFGFPQKFAICLSSSAQGGVVFFGDGPYVLHPHIDVSKSLLYTPLLKNPVSTASAFFGEESSTDYFIGLKSIKINGRKVPLNKTLLSIDQISGFGGTKISTVNPYTVMVTPVYNAFTKAFIQQLGDVPRVKAVRPFKLCFSSERIGGTRGGPAVPAIDLVLQNKSVYWRIFGANSMVKVSESTMCLGFVNGGVDQRTSIVIGGHQIEDNLLQFDLAASKLGFSSSLLLKQTACANFNFTSHPN
ncbi:probable aspartic proteinase GIP2 [Diospyros lotus]|uniref:probable aspartic proteinase GIP2 n=1 Tax=Diospyros lotus TaxID=55363 RepID=UPI00225BF757|nr:probable aspartic proteinase GIP2 [Diospyros lotus]